MNLGICLSLGDSFRGLARAGQDELFKEFYIKNLAKKFDNVYIFSYENEIIADLPKNVYLVPNRKSLHRYLYAFILPIVNYRYIKECHIFRGYHLTSTIPLILCNLLLGKKFIYNYAYDYKKFAIIEGKLIQYLLYFILEPLAFTFSSKIFAANTKILAKIGDVKGVYLPNGVDTNFFKFRRKINGKKKTVVSVGRLEKQKNYENLVKGMKGVNASLLIVGNGSYREKLLTLAKRCRVKMKIIDRVSHREIREIYEKADIFVLPSLIEGHPKVLLEAMSCGLPVIASRTEGILDIVNGENGILCNVDQEDINRSISNLLNDKFLQQMIARKARVAIVRKFNLKKLLETEIKVLRDTYSVGRNMII